MRAAACPTRIACVIGGHGFTASSQVPPSPHALRAPVQENAIEVLATVESVSDKLARQVGARQVLKKFGAMIDPFAAAYTDPNARPRGRVYRRHAPLARIIPDTGRSFDPWDTHHVRAVEGSSDS